MRDVRTAGEALPPVESRVVGGRPRGRQPCRCREMGPLSKGPEVGVRSRLPRPGERWQCAGGVGFWVHLEVKTQVLVQAELGGREVGIRVTAEDVLADLQVDVGEELTQAWP